MTTQRIVVGIDFSEPSMQTAQWVVRHFPEHELVLAHVISLPQPPPVLSSRYPRHDLLLGTVREGAERRLRDLSTSLGPTRIWPEIREGPVAPTLAAIGTEYGARLIAVGATGERHSGVGGPGATALQVVGEAAIPTLLVSRPENRTISRVLAPVDDESLAVDGLRWAVALAGAGGRVTALHVTAGGVMSHALSAIAVVSGVPPVTTPHIGPPESSDRWIALAHAAGIDTGTMESEGAFGDAVAEVVGAADRLDADLIVMGRRRAGGMRRTLLGSVTDGVLRHAHRNVLVVPEPKHAVDRH